MLKSFRFVASVALMLSVCACGSGYGTKQTVGTLAGAGLGGLAGASLFDGKGQVAAAAAGTLLGAWLGNEAGRSLDRADEVYARRDEPPLEYPPGGTAKPWRDPDTGTYGGSYGGSYGAGTPMATSESYGGCREFQHQARIGGEVRQVYGTACRSADGGWQVVKDRKSVV